MRRLWTIAIAAVVLGVIVVISGVWMQRAGRQQRNLADQLALAKETLAQFAESSGGVVGLRDTLSQQQTELEARLEANASDADRFSSRVEEAFAHLGVDITSSTPWQASEDFSGEGTAAFERTFEGWGDFRGLMDVVQTIESWPDGARFRALEVSPSDDEERLNFTLTLAVIRTAAARAEGAES